jgi:hypothetical protein
MNAFAQKPSARRAVEVQCLGEMPWVSRATAIKPDAGYMVEERRRVNRARLPSTRPRLQSVLGSTACDQSCALGSNVLHPFTLPPLSPFWNQRWRCSEVPWVKESGIA